MADMLAKSAQIHVRVTPELKRAVKVLCARTGTTEQAWVERMIEAELKTRAPQLPSPRQRRAPGRPPMGSR
ncbi:MAG: hypothetical protein IT454_12590 [Planctomycetes bacterium]|nr:hypothetical protein [Planctomycetota bacterium]